MTIERLTVSDIKLGHTVSPYGGWPVEVPPTAVFSARQLPGPSKMELHRPFRTSRPVVMPPPRLAPPGLKPFAMFGRPSGTSGPAVTAARPRLSPTHPLTLSPSHPRHATFRCRGASNRRHSVRPGRPPRPPFRRFARPCLTACWRRVSCFKVNFTAISAHPNRILLRLRTIASPARWSFSSYSR